LLDHLERKLTGFPTELDLVDAVTTLKRAAFHRKVPNIFCKLLASLHPRRLSILMFNVIPDIHEISEYYRFEYSKEC